MADPLNTCTRQILDIAPQIMQALRLEMRSHRGNDLSIPQFRALRFIHANLQACLSDLADYLGLTLPSASKLLDGLVKQALVLRQPSGRDRRRLVLALTPKGEKMILSVIDRAQEHLELIWSNFPLPTWRSSANPCNYYARSLFNNPERQAINQYRN